MWYSEPVYTVGFTLLTKPPDVARVNKFQVPSAGCTDKSHFVMQRLSPEGQTTALLLLIREKPDECDALEPFGTRIFYDYKELGLEEGDSFTILNPLSKLSRLSFLLRCRVLLCDRITRAGRENYRLGRKVVR